MLDKINKIKATFSELETQLSDSSVLSNLEKVKGLSSAHAELKDIVNLISQYEKVADDLNQAREATNSNDAEYRELALVEISELEPLLEQI